MTDVFDAYPKNVIIYRRPETGLSLSGPGPAALVRDRLRQAGIEPVEIVVDDPSSMNAIPTDLRDLRLLPLVVHGDQIARWTDRAGIQSIINTAA